MTVADLAAEWTTIGSIFVPAAAVAYLIALSDLVADLTETFEQRADAFVYFLGPAVVLAVMTAGLSNPISGWFVLFGALALRVVKKRLNAVNPPVS